jgi:GNAT superfamily N-acetyltransferase
MIRPFTTDDFPAIVAVHNSAFPEYPGTVEEWKFWEGRRDPKIKHARWVVEQDGGIVAYADYAQSEWSYHPQKFGVGITVHPEHEERGIGSELYRMLSRELEPHDPISFRSHAREDKTRAVRFLKDRGFVEEQREWESRLSVQAFDFTPYDGAVAKVQEQGVGIRTLREIESIPDWKRKLWELDWVLSQDVPHTEPLTQQPFDLWIGKHLESPNLLPDGYFLAVDNGEFVGVSNVWRCQASPEDFEVGLTGVRREYRRRGIALALKLCAVRYTKEQGIKTLKTWNEINNRAMLSINEALGFEKQPAWIEFVKTLKPE